MTEKNAMKAAKDFSWFKAAVALFYLAMGLVLVLWPESGMRYICYLVGGGIIVFGAFQVGTFLLSRESSLAFQLASGILNTLMGIFIVGWPDIVIPFMVVIVSVFIAADALFTALRAVLMQKAGCRDWAIYLLLGVGTLVLAVLFVMQPDLFEGCLSYVTGGVLIYEAVTAVVNMLRLRILGRKSLKAAAPEAPHEEKDY